MYIQGFLIESAADKNKTRQNTTFTEMDANKNKEEEKTVRPRSQQHFHGLFSMEAK